MRQFCYVTLPVCAFILLSSSRVGTPWNQKAQQIPGRVECEWYDLGGEGVGYHDTDSVNNGSGKLNPVNGNPLHEFRIKEGVDISYTKQGGVDDHQHNKVKPVSNQLYVGWTQPGEWINYTIKANESGNYLLSAMYTANRDAVIALAIDGNTVASHLKIRSTYDAADTIAWRQWHHWNRVDSLVEIKISKGIHMLTLKIEEQGNMNFDYIEFKKK